MARLRTHAALGLLPPLTAAEIERVADRVRLYGQTQPITSLDGLLIGGLDEYEGCLAAEVTPRITAIREPPCAVEYVLRQLPRNLTALDRAVIAVLAEELYKMLGRERMRAAGRMGGLQSRKGPRTVPVPFGSENWYETAAKVVGATPGAVKRLATLRRAAPDVFDAVRERRLTVLRDARDLAASLPSAGARSKVLRLRDEHPSLPVARLVADVMRSRRRPLPTSEGARASGDGWVIHHGPLAKVGAQIPAKTIDLVHADIVYGHVEMAGEIAELSARVLIDGGMLAMIAGHNVLDSMNAIAKHLTPIAIGSFHLGPGRGPTRPGPIRNVDALPVLIFGKGRVRQIAHVAYVGTAAGDADLNKNVHPWQKGVETTLDLITSITPRGSRVLDPCCGSGTTGVAALQHGCEFIGIDVDVKAVRTSRARLAAAEGARLPRKTTATVRRAA